MNYGLVFKTLGYLLFLLSFTMVLSLLGAVALEGPMPMPEAATLLWPALITAIFASGLILLYGRQSGDLHRKEGIAVVGLGWLICSLFGALPYLFSGNEQLGVLQAIFESTSGFTTTGATIIYDLDQIPHSILLWRAATQWLGGLGVLVLFIAVLSQLGVGSRSLFRHESSSQIGHSQFARIQSFAMALWIIYVLLTATCAIGLVIMGQPVFDAVTNAMTTLATGGFCVRDESIAYYQDWRVNLWITAFMVAGGINFLFYLSFIRRQHHEGQRESDRRRLRPGEEVGWYLVALLIFTCLVTIDLYLLHDGYGTVLESLQAASFQVTSIMTTTGYATEDYDKWPLFSCGVLLALMFFGGCAGSTAGGLKLMRLILLFKIAHRELVQTFRPTQFFRITLNGLTIDDAGQRQAIFLIALAGAFTIAATLMVCFVETDFPHKTTFNLHGAFSAVVSCLFNIGPGFGEVGPTQNYADLSGASLLILTFAMFLGRLEFFAVLVLFVPSLWKRY